MLRVIRRGMLVVLTAFLPVGADAGGLLNPFDTCGVCQPQRCFEFGIGFPGAFASPGCGGCGLLGNRCCAPPAAYGCGPAVLNPNPCGIGPTFTPSVPTPLPSGPSLAPSTSMWNCAPTPVCATPLQPQQITTYRNVPTVQYRREAYVQNVPVTTYQQITVPRTVYQPQTRYRDVAYTVNQTVAQTHTQYVPQPLVSYVPPTPLASVSCAPCGPSHAFSLTPQFAAPAYPSTIATTPAAPYAGATLGPVPTPIALPQSPTSTATPAATLQPPQYSADGGGSWQTVPQRQAHQNSGVEQLGGLLPSYAPPALPASRVGSSEARRRMFQPAPSAATVWQSRWMR